MTIDEMIAAGELMIEYATCLRKCIPIPAIQVKCKGLDDWEECINPFWDWGSFEYRRKPQPDLVPLTPRDISVGDRLRFPTLPGERMIIETTPSGVFAGKGYFYTFEYLKCENAEIRRKPDGEWRPCYNEITR